MPPKQDRSRPRDRDDADNGLDTLMYSQDDYARALRILVELGLDHARVQAALRAFIRYGMLHDGHDGDYHEGYHTVFDEARQGPKNPPKLNRHDMLDATWQDVCDAVSDFCYIRSLC